MKRVGLVLVLSVLASCSPAGLLNAVTGCTSFREGEHGWSDSLASEVRRQLDRRVPRIDLALHTDFDWDEVYFFHPYTEEKTIERAVEGDMSCSRVNVTEVTLIVFSNDDEVVEALDWKRPGLDFSDLGSEPYGVEEARFVIDRATLDWARGKPWYVFHALSGLDARAFETRALLMTAARELHDLNDVNFDNGRKFDQMEAEAAVRRLGTAKVGISMKRFRKHRYTVGFCLEARHRESRELWHLTSKDHLGPPLTGSCT